MRCSASMSGSSTIFEGTSDDDEQSTVYQYLRFLPAYRNSILERGENSTRTGAWDVSDGELLGAAHSSPAVTAPELDQIGRGFCGVLFREGGLLRNR